MHDFIKQLLIFLLKLVIGMAIGSDMKSLHYAGFVGIIDPPRDGCRESIEMVKMADVDIKMITGDSVETACSMGSQKIVIFFTTYTFLFRYSAGNIPHRR